MSKKQKRGFTLIELLVVVLIIGILAAVAVPQYQMAVEKSRLTTLKNITEAVAQAQEVYYLANGEYATTLSSFDVNFPGGGEVNESGNKITYPWGNCRIEETGVSCRNTQQKESLVYQVLYNHIDQKYAGKKVCLVVHSEGYSSLRNRLCQPETGKTKEDEGTSTLKAYAYIY